MKKLIGFLVCMFLVVGVAHALITPDAIVTDDVTFSATVATNSAVLSDSYTVFNSSGTSLETTLTIEAGKIYVITQTDAGTDGHTVDIGSGTIDATYNTITMDAQNETAVFVGTAAGVGVSLYNSAAYGN